MRKRESGVTLIELMIVIAIIAILGTIAIAGYRNTVMRANRADATAALVKVAANQEKLYIVNNTYADTATLTALGIAATERGYYTIAIAPNGANLTQGFTATATPVAGGPQAADATCTSLSIDNTGQKAFTGSGSLLECWK